MTKTKQQELGDYWLETYELDLSGEEVKAWWKRNIRSLISLVQASNGDVEEVKKCFRIANIWATNYGLKDYTINFVVRKYKELRRAVYLEEDKKIIQKHNQEKRNFNRTAKNFMKNFDIEEKTINENITKELHKSKY